MASVGMASIVRSGYRFMWRVRTVGLCSHDGAYGQYGVALCAVFPFDGSHRNYCASAVSDGCGCGPEPLVTSLQNVSMVNTVLCSIFASEFEKMSTKIEAGACSTRTACVLPSQTTPSQFPSTPTPVPTYPEPPPAHSITPHPIPVHPSAGADAAEVARATLNENWSIIFNGNGYDASWPTEVKSCAVCSEVSRVH